MVNYSPRLQTIPEPMTLSISKKPFQQLLPKVEQPKPVLKPCLLLKRLWNLRKGAEN